MSEGRVEGGFPASNRGKGAEKAATDRVQAPLPDDLVVELVKMRQNPVNFTVSGMSKCKFCSKTKVAYTLLNAKISASPIGSWCAVHGWLFFESVQCPPTERLTTSEIEEICSSEQRKREAAQRKARAAQVKEKELNHGFI